MGNRGGIPNKTERIRGTMKPTAAPYCQPQISPQRNTGMCMGSSMLPIWGICPVKKGSTRPSARNKAARVMFFRFLDILFLLHTDTKWMPDCDSLTLCQLLYNKQAELASPLARSACLVYRPFMANQASAYPARWEISCLISNPVVLMHRW